MLHSTSSSRSAKAFARHSFALLTPALALALVACSDGGDTDGGTGGTGGTGTGGSGATGLATGGTDAGVTGCTVPGGVTWEGKSRAWTGTNWAWKNWGADFGGISGWSIGGLSTTPEAYATDLSTMKASGVNVIRWWMWPRFHTESLQWDTTTETPTGLGGTLIADVEKALELAEQADVYIMFTPFSFDNFHPTEDVSGIWTPGLTAVAKDDTKRAALIETLVRPVAAAVEASPYKHRVIAWDVINEPEWAMTGADLYGGPAFEAQDGLDPLTHAEMETFVSDVITVLREESTALITVGSAAIKWGGAWTHVDIDFYSPHYYDWVYEWFPYTTYTPDLVGNDDKPILVGEFPLTGFSAFPDKSLPAVTVGQYLEDLYTLGYAGALGWAFNDESFAFDGSGMQSFMAAHPCESTY